MHFGTGVQLFLQALRHEGFTSTVCISGTATFGIRSCSMVSTPTERHTLEQIQYFTARISTKNWNAGYYNLLDILELSQGCALCIR